MSVKVRAYRRGGWHVDIRLVLPDGTPFRQRIRINVPSKTAAQRWGEARERHLLQHGPASQKKEVPTLAEFKDRFVKEHALAERLKPSGVTAHQSILTVHLVPTLGSKKLDAITTEDVQRLKHGLKDRARKTVNNILTTLNVLLKKAVEWGVIARMPCTIRLLPIPKGSAGFYDFDEYERLVDAARQEDANAYLIVLLGGEAGLRCGEMIALEWRDIDLAAGQVRIERSEWRSHVTAPKSGRSRYIPLTNRLAAGLREHRHLRGHRVLCQPTGAALTHNMVAERVKRAARRAHVDRSGVHRLRHTFCSHLAMRGAPARAIQELAGHQDLSTTQRYMHLSPAAIDGAIRLLDPPGSHVGRGNMLATGTGSIANSLT
jgi:integrase